MEHNPARLYRGPVGVVMEPLVRRLRGRGLARRHRWVWKAHRAVWRATRSNRVLIDGHDLELDMGDSLAIAKGWYEVDETEWYRSQVRTGDVVVEAGANIGYFTTLLARLVGPTGRVVAFEPDPELSRILERNVCANGYERIVDVRAIALADRPGDLTFYRARKNSGDNRLFSHGDDAAVFPVPVSTLDAELQGLGRPIDLLKMDIQGAEDLALAGFRHTLETSPPRRILMEFWPHGLVSMGADPVRLVDGLVGRGYSVRALGASDPFDVRTAVQALTVENEDWVNLVLVHESAEARP